MCASIGEREETHNKQIIILFLSLLVTMDLIHMLVFCCILFMQNSSGNFPVQLFIDSKGFTGIDDFYMLNIKEVPNMIKDNNLVTNEEARLGAIQQLKLQVLVWWSNDIQSHLLAIIVAKWTAVELKSPITQINIDSSSGGDIKLAHPAKLETGHKWKT